MSKRSLVKKIGFSILYLSHAHVLLRKKHKRDARIVLYHGVAPDTKNGIYNYRKKFVSPESFERQLAYYQKYCTVMPLDELVRTIAANETLPDNAVALTFDDGYENFYAHAYPLLKKYSMPATMFLVGSYIQDKMPLWVDRLEYAIGHSQALGDMPDHERAALDATIRQKLKRLPAHEREARLKELEHEHGTALRNFQDQSQVYAPLGWEQIIEMEKGGLITFGAHTMTHPILTKLPSDEAYKEILDSKNLLDTTLANPSRVFCYPNGHASDFDQTIKKQVADIGFAAALSTIFGRVRRSDDLYALKRVVLDNTDAHCVFVTTFEGVKNAVGRFLGKG